jgi:hypothetical protein
MSIQTLLSNVQEITHTITDKRNFKFDCQLLGYGLQSMDTSESSKITKHLTAITGKHSGSVELAPKHPTLTQCKPKPMIGPESINQAYQPNKFLPIDKIDQTICLLQGLIQ